MTDKIRVRPHYHRKGDEIYFMISRRPVMKLSQDEAALWEALPAVPQLHELSASASRAVPRFLKGGICDLVPARFPAKRTKVLIIEPHCDDAALSIGGILWQWRNSHAFTIATLGGRSNFTSYFFSDRAYFDPQKVSAMRDAEGDQYAAMIGGKYIGLRNNEATLRFHDATWDEAWFSKNKFAVLAGNNHRSSRAEHDAWKGAVRDLLKQEATEEVWLPLGAGQHTDHEITRNVCLELLSEGAMRGRKVCLYSDVPYDHKFPVHKADILRTLKERGAALSEKCHDISGDIEMKLKLLSVFGSQFKLDAIRHGVNESARLAGGGKGLHECLWVVDTPPHSWDWQQIDSYAPLSASEISRFKAWLSQFRSTGSVRLLLLNPAGRFKNDVLALRQMVPHATVDVFASRSAQSEVESAKLTDVALHEVGDGGANWVKLAAKLALAQRRPTLFVAGDRLEQARKLAKMWPGSQTLVAGTLDEIMRGLRLADGTSA